MKLVVIGSGQCGNRIADEFAQMDRWTLYHRGMKTIIDAFAVNTDEADLSGLKFIRKDYHHRILLGAEETSGHGVGKLNEIAATLARNEGQKVLDAINTTRDLYEADAFLVIGSGGGGTGSGSVPIIVEQIKRQYSKPVYSLIVLPYTHEEVNEERTKLNTAACLKAAYQRSDAVLLIDNQRYASLFGRVADNFTLINRQIVKSFRDLLCTGEERKRKWIAGRVVDAGDIIATLEGWTAIGWGGFDVPLLSDFSRDKTHFLRKSAETRKGIGAVKKALSLISVQCDAEEYQEAQKALYLLSSPAKEMNQDIIRESENYLKSLMPRALIRGGDYPREKGTIEGTVILSKMGQLTRIKEIYQKGGEEYQKKIEEWQKDYEQKVKALQEWSRGVPDL